MSQFTVQVSFYNNICNRNSKHKKQSWSYWWKKQQFRLIQFFSKNILTHFRHISAYYQVMFNCETVSLLQFYKFIIKCWQWCLKGNKLMRLNKLPWNEREIFRILYQIDTNVPNWCFYLAMVYLLLEGFLWFPIQTFCSHALKY